MSKNNLKTILIVEDDLQTQEILYKKISSTDKYKVLIADDGKEALEMVDEFLPDLIILDLILPKMDGVETLKEIRGNEKYKNVKVIVLSNLTYLGDEIEDLENKVQDHLVKTNTELEQIIQKIDEVLKR